MKFVIKGRLSSLNDYVRACRTSSYLANDMKKKNEIEVIAGWLESSKREKITKYPVNVSVKWYEPNAKRDVDNICFGIKFILDALVKNKVLENDDQKHIKSITHEVLIDKERPRIEVEIGE